MDIRTRGVYRAVPGAAPIGKRHLLVTRRWHMLRAGYDLPGRWRQSCRRPVQRDQCRLRRFMPDRGGIVGKEAVTT
jgi:hypothetical protein